MQRHQLFDHPMFEEQPLRDILAPFGFEVSVGTIEPPIDPIYDEAADVDAYSNDPVAYINSLAFNHPEGFTEIDRGENDEGDIYSAAVRAKTAFAQALLCGDALAAHVVRLQEALAPFADAWQRREPKGDPSTRSYQRRLERALGVFYSNGNMDDRALTGQHLREAASALSAPIDIASLASLKAQWQAEALDEAAMDIRADYGHLTQYNVSLMAAGVEGYARTKRRQYEGGES